MSGDAALLSAQLNGKSLEIQALRGDQGKQKITIGHYLLSRLVQLGVKSMFGLPGDFNLGFLDLIEDHPGMQWVGSCNELNAAYAADGYARVKEGTLGAITTTFGVGELSAMNGIAGAYSEMVPVLHITGVPSTKQFMTKPLLHHTLGDGRFDVYGQAAAPFVVHQCHIRDNTAAAAQIDFAIQECITKARPVYLTLPTDLVYQEVSSERLSIPLSPVFPLNDNMKESFVLDQVVQRVDEAKGDVLVLVDACVIRHGARKEVADFLKETHFPVYSTPMGKTAVNENNPRYGGIYVGTLTAPEIKEKVENASLILSFGALGTDFNTGNFSYEIPKLRLIEFHSTWTQVQYAWYDEIGMKQLLPRLSVRLRHLASAAKEISVPKFVARVPKDDSSIITHSWLWPRLASFFKANDVIVTETGTANFGILDVPLPADAILVNQILWGSIGWSVGSCLGAALAARELGKDRVILFVGDGSLQLTVQELSPMIRHGLKPIIFVLNNRGYTIERCIHGKHRKYNDIADWKWTDLLETLNDHSSVATASHTAHNKQDLSTLLDNASFGSADKIRLVEVMMDTLDAPSALVRQADLTGKSNQYGN